MASSREQLYRETCDFLKEGYVAPGSSGKLAPRIAGQEQSAAEFLLGEHPYNFASRTQRLVIAAQTAPDTAEEDIDPALGGYQYAYIKPAVARINWVSRTARMRDRLRQGWDDKEGRILSNYNPLYLDGVLAEYALAAKIGYWPASFLTAVASMIADRLTGPVTNSRGWASDMSARSIDLVEASKLWDANQAPAPRRREGSWLRSRLARGPGRDYGW